MANALLAIFIVLGAAGTEFAYWRLRRHFQDRMDMNHRTWEITWPAPVPDGSAELLLQSLAGLYKHPGIVGNTWGYPTLVWEILGTQQGLHFLLSFPREMTPMVQGSLLSVMPSAGFEEVVRPRIPWRYAVEMRRHEKNEVEADRRLVSTLLASMRDLGEGEAAMVQLVTAPTGAGIAGREGDPYYVQGRIAAAGVDIRARQVIERVTVAYRSLGVMSFQRVPTRFVRFVEERRAPLARWKATASTATLAVLAGIPEGSEQILGLRLGGGRKLIAAPSIPTEGIRLGTSTFPGALRLVALAPSSLRVHQFVLGGTGSGKSTLLHNEAVQVMEKGEGLILIEPKGDLARAVLASVPSSRKQDVVWFDPADRQAVTGLNVLEGPDPEHTAMFITGLIRNLYNDSWGPRLEYILRWSIQTAALNGLTLYDVKHLLLNAEYRARVLRGTKDIEVRSFWKRLELGADNQLDSVINKLDAFVGFSMMRNIVGQAGGLSVRDVIRDNKILLVPLDEKRIDESNVAMLGSILVSQIWSEIGRRSDKRPYTLVLDECQRFLRLAVSIEDALAQARSYELGLVLACQNLDQLGTGKLQAAIMANARTKISFGLEDKDARAMAGVFSPLSAGDLRLLGQYEVAISMMTPEGQAPVATARTMPAPRPTGHGTAIVAASRALYGRPVAEVEAELLERFRSHEDERQKPAIGRRVRS